MSYLVLIETHQVISNVSDYCGRFLFVKCISRRLWFVQKALHMRSLKTFKDDFGVVRKNGEEWLIKMSDTETHIPNVYEEVGIVHDHTIVTVASSTVVPPS